MQHVFFLFFFSIVHILKCGVAALNFSKILIFFKRPDEGSFVMLFHYRQVSCELSYDLGRGGGGGGY